jgi:hypothetical protein
MSRPTIKVEIAFTTKPTESPAWADVSSYVRAVETNRGRNMELDTVEAGTATVVLDNRDRRFDQTNSAGPYYGYLVPMRRLRVSAVWEGITYPIFTGYVERWPLSYQGLDAIVEVPVTDGFKVLNLARLNTSYAQEKSGARVARVLNDAGWTAGQSWVLGSAVNGVLNQTTRVGPVGDREIQAGIVDVQAVTLKDVSALEHLQAVAEAEDGLLFIGKAGQVVFYDRVRQYLPPYNTPAVVFGDGEEELPFSNVELSCDDTLIYNEVRVTREGGTEQVAQDTVTQQEYFRRTLSRSGLLVTTDVSALGLAYTWLGRYKDPYVRASKLLFEAPLPDDLWPALLKRELGDRIAVTFQPPGGGARVEREVLVQGISHKVTDESWVIELCTTPADAMAIWILGTSQLGVTTRLLAG